MRVMPIVVSCRAAARRACVAFLGVALLLAPRPGTAQATSAPADAPVCLGFSFGPWTPALDWRAAGHGAPVDSARVPRAPGGRGWAASDAAPLSDTTVMLFPPWWPVGVMVDLASKAPAAGDTVAGRAMALVNDGRRRSPTSRVRAWRVPCGG
jgi:hypothetical protein